MAGGKADDGNEKTIPGDRAENEEDAAIRASADALGRAARAVEEGLRLVLTVHPDHRGVALRSAAQLLGQLGDLCHEKRRAIARLRDSHYGIDGID